MHSTSPCTVPHCTSQTPRHANTARNKRSDAPQNSARDARVRLIHMSVASTGDQQYRGVLSTQATLRTKEENAPKMPRHQRISFSSQQRSRRESASRDYNAAHAPAQQPGRTLKNKNELDGSRCWEPCWFKDSRGQARKPPALGSRTKGLNVTLQSTSSTTVSLLAGSQS